jgi:hypothetical protein
LNYITVKRCGDKGNGYSGLLMVTRILVSSMRAEELANEQDGQTPQSAANKYRIWGMGVAGGAQ